MKCSLNFEALIHNDVLVFCKVLSLDLLGQLDLLHYFVEVGSEGCTLGSSGSARRGYCSVIVVSISAKGTDGGFATFVATTSSTEHRVAADLVYGRGIVHGGLSLFKLGTKRC